MCPLYWEPSIECSTPNVEQRRTIISLNLLAMLCLKWPRRPFALRAHCWFMVSYSPVSYHTAFPETGFVLPQGQGLMFHEVPVGMFLHLSRSLWMAAHLFGVSASSPSFVSSASLLWVHFVPPSSLFKIKWGSDFKHETNSETLTVWKQFRNWPLWNFYMSAL